MSYEEAVRYLDSFINYEKRAYDYKGALRPGRVKRLLASIGDPQDRFKAIHVAGTKGKGSTSAFIYNILREEGPNAGLYTSPHLATCRERIAAAGRIITEGELVSVLGELRPSFEGFRDEGLSFFEVYTAIAFAYFRRRRVEVAVLEVGLGGRLDATNAARGLVSVITPISLEHTNILGGTAALIAAEKAGVIKEGARCVSSPQAPEALAVIEEACGRKGATLRAVGRDIRIENASAAPGRERFSVRTPSRFYNGLESGLLGAHQIANAALAVGAVEALDVYGISVGVRAVSRGISNTVWPGRLEVIGGAPAVVLDGAQNRASAGALCAALDRHFGGRAVTLVIGICRDKDLSGVCGVLARKAERAILTRSRNPRAAEPGEIEVYFQGLRSEMIHDPRAALERARAVTDPEGIVLVTGSLYLVGEIRELIKEGRV